MAPVACVTSCEANTNAVKRVRLKSVKLADKPDSVHSGCPLRDRHYSGPGVAHPARCYLPANSPCGTTRQNDTANRPR